uniref:Transposase n=1 Tax=Romanomermis culicivorax TaxID=13658 RepID=A0A915J2Y4_ROMCU
MNNYVTRGCSLASELLNLKNNNRLCKTRKYNWRYDWTLEYAYGYLVRALRHLLMEWASWKRNKDARKEGDRLAALVKFFNGFHPIL